jgi:hypothetical protein
MSNVSVEDPSIMSIRYVLIVIALLGVTLIPVMVYRYLIVRAASQVIIAALTRTNRALKVLVSALSILCVAQLSIIMRVTGFVTTEECDDKPDKQKLKPRNADSKAELSPEEPEEELYQQNPAKAEACDNVTGKSKSKQN